MTKITKCYAKNLQKFRFLCFNQSGNAEFVGFDNKKCAQPKLYTPKNAELRLLPHKTFTTYIRGRKIEVCTFAELACATSAAGIL